MCVLFEAYLLVSVGLVFFLLFDSSPKAGVTTTSNVLREAPKCILPTLCEVFIYIDLSCFISTSL